MAPLWPLPTSHSSRVLEAPGRKQTFLGQRRIWHAAGSARAAPPKRSPSQSQATAHSRRARLDLRAAVGGPDNPRLVHPSASVARIIPAANCDERRKEFGCERAGRIGGDAPVICLSGLAENGRGRRTWTVTEKAKEARQRAEALFRKQERATREVDAARAMRTAQAEATEEKTARLKAARLAKGAVANVVGIRGWRNLRLVPQAKTGVGAPAEITP